MKNLFFTLLLTLFACATAFAQGTATFNVFPDTVFVSWPMNITDVEADNHIQNLTNATRNIKWERTVISISPDTLKTQVCDPNACYATWIDTKTFAISPGATQPMIVHFLNNSGQPANAIVQLKYTDLADQANPQYAYYVFDASLVGTDDQLPAANVRLFPNPMVESFTLENAEEVSRVHVFTLEGRRLALLEAAADGNYSLAGQPAGSYLIALEGKNGKVFQAIQVKKQ